jgi:hypothetical protein
MLSIASSASSLGALALSLSLVLAIFTSISPPAGSGASVEGRANANRNAIGQREGGFDEARGVQGPLGSQTAWRPTRSLTQRSM